jgi:hypothetical protein
MATKPKQIINHSMTGDKSLSLTLEFKFPHLPFLLSTRLMG